MTEAERDDAVRLIKGEYFDFLLSGPKAGEEGDNKLVGARHATGKGILTHLEFVMRLGGAGEGEAGDAGGGGGGHLGSARAEIASLGAEEEAGADDAGDG